jgi:transcriptional repressor NrdR
MQLACAKRPVPAGAIEAMADEVEDALARRGEDEVPSLVIGELIMDRLKSRDHVAYVRYASVYRNFQDLEEFYEELRDLTARRARAAMSEGQAELPFSESS